MLNMEYGDREIRCLREENIFLEDGTSAKATTTQWCFQNDMDKCVGRRPF